MSERADPTPPPNSGQAFESLSVSLNLEIERLVNDLRARWRRGERVPIESLGDGYSQVAQHEEQLLDLIYHEVLLREEFGESPRVDEYAARFPQYVERLQRLFAVHGAIESEWDADSPDGEELPASSTEWSHTPGSPRNKLTSRRRAAVADAPPGYELLDELGRGGMAIVFRARQKNLDRVVALKMILGGAITGPEVLARFEQEARTVAQLQHSGIVQIYEVGDHRGLPYLSLEYIAGGTLHDWLQGRPLAPAEAARLIEQLARTTHFAHERGVIHRDLKPANILLTHRPAELASDSTVMSDSSHNGDGLQKKDVQLKIADFGLARMLGSAHNLTMTGQVLGTPSYMPPEQARGSGDDAGPALDVYSLGAILYELLTGHPPFRGATLLDTLDQVRNAEPISPRRLQPRVPRDLDTICLKCLEKSPEHRYATAKALADDLLYFIKGEAITARPVRMAERLWKWARRSPTIAISVVVAVVFAVAGMAGIVDGARRARMSAADARKERDKALLSRDVANSERERADEERRLARLEEAKAQEARAEADLQRQAAEAEKTRAVAARRDAELNFRSALDAVNALSKLGRQLRGEPHQQAASQKIFDETLRFYEGFLTKRSQEPAIQHLAALALVEAGTIRSDMGQFEKAHELLDRSASLLADVLERFPNDLPVLRSMAGVQWHRGNLLRYESKWDDADRAYLDSIAIHERVLALPPGHYSDQVAKANAIVNRCVVLQFNGRMREAADQYAVAASILRKILQSRPRDDHVRSELALCLDDLGKLHWFEGRQKEAEPLLREALAAREQFYSRRPNDAGVRTHLTRSLAVVARCEASNGNFEAAEAMLQRASDVIEPLLEDFPDIYSYHLELYNVYVEQLRVAVRRHGVVGAEPRWEKLRDFLARAVKRFPEDKFFADRHTGGRLRFAHLFWESPDGLSLIRTARDLLPMPKPAPDRAPTGPTESP